MVNPFDQIDSTNRRTNKKQPGVESRVRGAFCAKTPDLPPTARVAKNKRGFWQKLKPSYRWKLKSPEQHHLTNATAEEKFAQRVQHGEYSTTATIRLSDG
ncbi:hypothetical protein RUM43_005063 [Polyplax serrata]|uniref:Uncharacterized protein n=1 Tax=Polyplax serrata TaxID=468196 RepID=A0AAN8XM50_POLSC